jgi:hypothetical protein
MMSSSDGDSSDSDAAHDHDACVDNAEKFQRLGVIGFTHADKNFYGRLAEDLDVDASFVSAMDVCRYLKFVQLWLAKAGKGKNSRFPFCCFAGGCKKPLAKIPINFT